MIELQQRIRMKHIDDELRRVYDCPACQIDEIKIPDHVFYGRCPTCNLTLIDYQPLEHQEAFHKSTAQYKMNLGGFGSGKTTASCAELAAAALSTPYGRSLITAPILDQVKDAVIPELEKFLPSWFVEKSRKHPRPYYKLTNGHEILVYASDNPDDLRSLNLTAFYMEEASGIKYEIFDQLMTRLRHKGGIIKDSDGNEIGYKYLGIISSNPEDGWLMDKFLLMSDKIVGSPSVDTATYEKLKVEKPNRHFHSFLSSTRDNKFIPAEFIERMSAGKDARWVRKYIDCYLDVVEGAVYPDFSKNVIEPFEIPKDWKRIGGFDPGFNDPTAALFGAIDPKDGCIYVYQEYYEPEQPITYHAHNMKKLVAGLDFYMPIQGDPSIAKRNDRDGQSYKAYFYRQSGIMLEEANNDILFGIEKVRDYMYAGKLKFFSSLHWTKWEMLRYKYNQAGLRDSNKPVDRDNHLMDCLRYMIAPLPQNPNDMNTIYLSSRSYAPLFTPKITNVSNVWSGDTIHGAKRAQYDEKKVIYGGGVYGKRF